MKRFTSLFALLVSGLALAQVFPDAQEPMFWGDSQIILVKQKSPLHFIIEKEKHGKIKQQEYPTKDKCRSFDVAFDRFWKCETKKDTAGLFTFSVFNQFEPGMWHQLGCGSANKASEAWEGAFPLDASGTRFVVLSPTCFEKDGKASPFGIGRRTSNNQLQLEEILDMGMGESPLKPLTGIKNLDPLGMARLQPWYLKVLVPGTYSWARSSKALVFWSGRVGYFWIAQPTDTSYKWRQSKLFSGVTLEEIKKGPLEFAILGCQPRRNGHFLVASRSEDAVLKARRGEGIPVLAAPPTEAQAQAILASNAPSLKRYPEILWWDLDPETGTFTRESAPPGAPSHLEELESFNAFRFRFDPREKLLISK